MIKRCSWVEEKEEIYIRYHDEEWGTAKYDDDILFEMLVLESFQSGLSWITVLKKRESFRKAFDDFNINKIVDYDDGKVRKLLENENIIRHEGKIRATISNAKAFMEIQKEYGSFSDYIWGFTDGEIIKAEYKTESELSDKISKDLKKKGMKFVGSTTVYSYLEAIGVIDNHEKDCFRY